MGAFLNAPANVLIPYEVKCAGEAKLFRAPITC